MLTAVTGAADIVVLQERARIARELHDTVSQTLYAIALSGSRALRLLEQKQPNKLQPIIEEVLKLANAGQSEVRELLADINPDPLTPEALTDGLADLAADVRTRHGLDIRLSLEDEPDLPPTAKKALTLICREALHNIVRHAAADRARISLQVGAGETVLLIADNGRGFDPAVFRPGHFGLQSMRERAAAIGGTLELQSVEAAGTQVCVRVSQRGANG
jgi:signal transduction histidine kinase